MQIIEFILKKALPDVHMLQHADFLACFSQKRLSECGNLFQEASATIRLLGDFESLPQKQTTTHDVEKVHSFLVENPFTEDFLLTYEYNYEEYVEILGKQWWVVIGVVANYVKYFLKLKIAGEEHTYLFQMASSIHFIARQTYKYNPWSRDGTNQRWFSCEDLLLSIMDYIHKLASEEELKDLYSMVFHRLTTCPPWKSNTPRISAYKQIGKLKQS